VDEKAAKALAEFPRQALHAAQLEFIHPISKNKVALKAPPPQDMKSLLHVLEKSFS
jgi:23S rRNA pseudouridine1911/1915/1917 synthase